MKLDEEFVEKRRKELSKEVRCFKWTRGRQLGEYLIMPLVRTLKLPFDMYLIKYPKGSYIPPHTDPVKKGAEHHRVNFVIKKPKAGGEYQGEYEWKWWRFMKLRPDIHEHSVTEVTEGTRWVLSLGWIE